MEIIKALEKSGLVGLGGAGFPTYKKWQMVKDAKDQKRFVICNLMEGEPGVFKDEYIIKHHLSELIAGIELAAGTIFAQKSYIFLNDKYKKYQAKITKHLRGKKIEIFIDTGRYLCGEESTLLQVMEGKIRQPRSKPPFPTTVGLFGYPTLINNAETLYRAYLVSEGKYLPKRFYSLSGDLVQKQIIEAPTTSTIKDVINNQSILKSTKFYRIAGTSGYFLPADKIDEIIDGTGAIEIFGLKRKIFSSLTESILFLKTESCGKCTPCREGSYRIAEKLNQLAVSNSLWDKKEMFEIISEIAKNASDSSFCALGKSISRPVMSAIEHFKAELCGE